LHDEPVPSWLYLTTLLVLLLALAGGAILSVGIALGWNNPRPVDPPNWEPAATFFLESQPDESYTVTALRRAPQAFVFEAVATPLEDPDAAGYGLAFHLRELDRYTVFAIGGDGYVAALRIEKGRETPLLDWQPFPHVRRGASANRLRLACGQGLCRFWVNDEYVAALPNEGGAAGDVGLWVGPFQDQTFQVRFEQITLWEDGQ